MLQEQKKGKVGLFFRQTNPQQHIHQYAHAPAKDALTKNQKKGSNNFLSIKKSKSVTEANASSCSRRAIALEKMLMNPRGDQ